MFAFLLIVRPFSGPSERAQRAPGSMQSLSESKRGTPFAEQLKRHTSQSWESLAKGWRALGTRASNALKRLWPARITRSLDGSTMSPRNRRMEPTGMHALAFTGSGMLDDGDRLAVRIEAPGMQREDLDVQVHGDVLTVRGIARFDSQRTRGRWRLVQYALASFRRDIALPVPVQIDRISACYRDGVLHIELPKDDTARARRITVKPA